MHTGTDITATTTTDPRFADLTPEQFAAQQALFAEAKSAQKSPSHKGQAFHWITLADDHGDDGSELEQHHATLTSAMDSYGYSDLRGWSVKLQVNVNGTVYEVRDNTGFRTDEPWLQVLLSDTSHIERTLQRVAAAK